MRSKAKIALGIAKWSLLAAYLLTTLSFADRKTQALICTGIEVKITDSMENRFVRSKDVVELIEQRMYSPIGHPLKQINTLQMEEYLSEILASRSVSAYKTSEGKLRVRIEQRNPIMRIINRNGRSFYIDSDGKVFPLSSKFTSHVLVVNGNISETFEAGREVCEPVEGSNPAEKPPLICGLFQLARYIAEDSFWNAQIAQVYVDSPNSIELIPRVGPHVILLGSIEDYEGKLSKLKLFYEQALPVEGWNKYKLVNLKYNNQIICTKR